MPRHASRTAPTSGHENAANPTLRDEDLPHHNDPAWVRRRKIRVVAAVHGGLIPLYVALQRFNLTAEEFLEWEREVRNELARKKHIFRATITGRTKRFSKKRRSRK